MPQIRVTDAPESLLAAVNERAAAAEMSVEGFFAVSIATRFGVDLDGWEPGPWTGGATTTDLTLKVPVVVRDVLRREGPLVGKTIRGVALNSVALAVGHAPVDEERRPR